MKTILLSDIEIKSKEVMQDIMVGNERAVIQEDNNEIIAVIVPYLNWGKSQSRQLGTLKDKGTVSFAPDFKITDKELINL